MVVPGSLNDLAHSLAVAPAVGGQLITAGAMTMGVGAPLLAAALGGWDRRRLLTLALAWYALGHLLAALMPHFAALLPVRAISVLGAAVFTPQAAAAITVMAAPHERGRLITFVFLGWSLASVLGMPLHSYIGEAFGWRWAFGLVALLSVAGAVAVWRTMPDGIRPPPMSLAGWRHALTHPLLMGIVVVTVLSGAGQFTLFSYFAPYYRQELGASAAAVSLLFLWFGAFGLAGNLLVSRWIDRGRRPAGDGAGAGAVGAGLLRVQLGAAGACLDRVAGAGAGAAGAQYLGHLCRPGHRRSRRRRVAGGRRLCAAVVGRAGVDGAGDRAQRTRRVAHAGRPCLRPRPVPPRIGAAWPHGAASAARWPCWLRSMR
jgi:predicted MFS family arabinose efflux permease